MRYKRASESPSKSMSRRELNRTSMSNNKALEHPNESMTRREQIRFTLTEHSGHTFVNLGIIYYAQGFNNLETE